MRSNTHGKTSPLLLIGIAVLALGSGAGVYIWQQSGKEPTSKIKNTSIIGQTRPTFRLPDVDGKEHDATQWDGQVMVLNFWATWCPPCRREIPAFIELQEKYQARGVSVVGIALDNRQAAVDFVDPMGINYPILVGETEGIALTQSYGNQLSILPYTVVVDRKGIIRATLSREVSFEEAEKLISPLL